MPDEYLLVNPSSLAVNDNGDIIVPDEYFLKIFDGAGRPKSMLGGPGEGPGEFSRSPRRAFISETGYITAIASGANVYRRYNIYDPGYNFIEQVNLQYSDAQAKFEEKFTRDRIRFRDIYYFSPEETLYWIDGSNYPSSTQRTEGGGGGGGRRANLIDVWLYKNNQTMQFVFTEEEKETSLDGYPLFREEGVIHFGQLNNRRMVSTHAAKNKSFENITHYYSLFVYDIAAGGKSEIKQSYTQISIPDSVIYSTEENSSLIDELRAFNPEAAAMLANGRKNREEERSKRLEIVKFYPGVKEMLTDGDFIFVFTHELVENEGHVVHVIDSRTGERISRAYFPFGADPIYETMVIKNGYAYRITNNKDGFKIVEKYKIDPAVYRK